MNEITVSIPAKGIPWEEDGTWETVGIDYNKGEPYKVRLEFSPELQEKLDKEYRAQIDRTIEELEERIKSTRSSTG